MKKLSYLLFICFALFLNACSSDDQYRDEELVLKINCENVILKSQSFVSNLEYVRRANQYMSATDEMKTLLKQYYFNNETIEESENKIVIGNEYSKITIENNGKSLDELGAIWTMSLKNEEPTFSAIDFYIAENIGTNKWETTLNNFPYTYLDENINNGKATILGNSLSDESNIYTVTSIKYLEKSTPSLQFSNTTDLLFMNSRYTEGEFKIQAYPKGLQGGIVYNINLKKETSDFDYSFTYTINR